MLCLISSLIILGTTPELKCEEPPKIEIVLGESNSQKQEREAREERAREEQARQAKIEKNKQPYKYDSTVTVIGDSYEQCTVYAKRVSGNPKAGGFASKKVPEGQEPKIGAIALERNYGHVSVVVGVDGDYITLHDANWVRGHITERRVHKDTQRGYIY